MAEIAEAVGEPSRLTEQRVPMSNDVSLVLVTGSTGYIGGRLPA